MGRVTAAVMSNDRPDSRLPHILDRLGPLDPVVVRDRGNPWRTAREAWLAAGPEASHHLVVQNDIRISAALPAAVEQLAAALPDAAIAFYCQWDTNSSYRVRMGTFGGDTIVQASAREWVPAQALLLPRRVCEAAAHIAEDVNHADDEVLAELLYLSADGCPVGITVPNLVEHDDEPKHGYNQAAGLRRTACFAGDQPWLMPAPGQWDGPGWNEISVLLDPTGAQLDWGIRAPWRMRWLRRIRFPWRHAVPLCGLRPEEVAAVGERTLLSVGLNPRQAGGEPAATFRLAALFEYAIAGVLHGVAWRNWWRGGRPAGELRRSPATDAALATLWRSCRDLPLPGDVLTELGHQALHAGARLDGVRSQEESHARLVEWFRTSKWSLSMPLHDVVAHGGFGPEATVGRNEGGRPTVLR